MSAELINEGPSDDYKCGYTAGYDQAQFDLSQPPLPEHKTLRDEFATAALTGIMESIGSANPAIVAEDAYRIADAMMKAREVKS